MWGKPNKSRKEYMRDWRAKNRARVNAESRERYKQRRPESNREYHRRQHLKRHYGLTIEEYQALSVAQDHVCAICRRPETAIRRGTYKSLDVDHNHETGVIRGLLCSACNTALGLLKEDSLRMRAMATYIEREPLCLT